MSSLTERRNSQPRAGETVVCIDAEGSCGLLREGEHYAALAVDLSWPPRVMVESGPWALRRFRKLRPHRTELLR